MSLLTQSIERFDLHNYVQSYGVVAEMPGGELIITCPTCGKEKLCVNPHKRTWHCWVCEQYGAPDQHGRRLPVAGAGGLVALIALLEGLDQRKAAERILAAAAFTAEELAVIPQMELRSSYLEMAGSIREIPAPPSWCSISGTLPYMLESDITLDDARIFGLGWCTHGRYRDRFIYPVWEQGKFVYFQARAMWKEADRPGERYIKALNPSREEGAAVSSDVLFNLDQARMYPRVAIVEGPKDAVKTGPDAVCTFGKKISPTQVAKLLRAGVRALDFIWDGPSPTEPHGAWPEMFAAAPMLSALFDLRLVFLPYGDPGQRSRAELDWHRSQGRPFGNESRLASV